MSYFNQLAIYGHGQVGFSTLDSQLDVKVISPVSQIFAGLLFNNAIYAEIDYTSTYVSETRIIDGFSFYEYEKSSSIGNTTAYYRNYSYSLPVYYVRLNGSQSNGPTLQVENNAQPLQNATIADILNKSIRELINWNSPLKIFGSGSNDTLVGGASDDVIYGELGRNSIVGGTGNDSLYGAGSSGDTIQGGDGNDYLIGGDNSDSIYGEAGNDKIFTNSGNNFVDGGADDDSILGGNGSDTLTGGSGADTISGHTGKDSIDGGAGNDQLYVASISAGDTTIRGGDGNDSLSGGGGNDYLDGGADEDLIDGFGGNDTLLGGGGADTLRGGAGSDILVGGAGADSFAGGTEIDVVSYATSSAFFLSLRDFSASTGDAAGDIIDSTVEIIVGSQADDKIELRNVARTVFGNGADDTIIGGTGNDFISGDNELGAAISIATSTILFVTLQPVDGRQGFGADSLMGGSGQDTLLGGEGADTLVGGADQDTLVGGDGNDRLVAGDWIGLGVSPDNAANLLVGGLGNDTLDGWTGQGLLADTLDGGDETDIYWADGKDRIVKFELGETAFFATNGPIGSYVVYSPRLGDTTVSFFDSSGIDGTNLGVLTFGERVLPEELLIRAPLQSPGLAIAEIVHQSTSTSTEAQIIANIWATARTEQYKLVIWKIAEELIGQAAGAAFAKKLGASVADRLAATGLDQATSAALDGFVETVASETIAEVVTNILKQEQEILSASDAALILAEATAGIYGKPLKELVSWGPTVAQLVWLQVKAAFDQAVINLVGLPDSTAYINCSPEVPGHLF